MDILSTGASVDTMTENVAKAAKDSGINIKIFDLQTLFNAGLTFGISLLVIIIILKIIDHIQKASLLDNTLKSFIRSGVKAMMWVITINAVLFQFGFDTKSLVAIVSVVGLALSLSLQSTLSNLFSGLTILTTKPFTAGDYVEIGEAAGTISVVELFYTTMLTVENKTIFIPNSQVTSAKIVNYSREKERRIELKLGIDYSVPTDVVKTALLDAAKADDRILSEPVPFVGLLSYQVNSIEFVLRAWAKKEDYWDVYFDLTERVRTIFQERGVSITYNHLNVHMIDEKKA